MSARSSSRTLGPSCNTIRRFQLELRSSTTFVAYQDAADKRCRYAPPCRSQSSFCQDSRWTAHGMCLLLCGRHMECAYYFDFCRLCPTSMLHTWGTRPVAPETVELATRPLPIPNRMHHRNANKRPVRRWQPIVFQVAQHMRLGLPLP